MSSEQAQPCRGVLPELARLNLERAKDLRTQGGLAVGSRQPRGRSVVTAGDVDIAKATIAKKTIRAPFSGQLGIREVNLDSTSTRAIRSSRCNPRSGLRDFNLRSSSSPTSRRARRSVWSPTPPRPDVCEITAHNPEMDPKTRNAEGVHAVLNTRTACCARNVRQGPAVPPRPSVLVVPATVLPTHRTATRSRHHRADGREERRHDQAGAHDHGAAGRTRADWVVVTNGLTKGQMVATSGVFARTAPPS